MALRRGMKAVREAKEKNDQRGDWGPRRVILAGGESMIFRFFGNFEDEEDPVVSMRHYIKRLPKDDRYQQCAENAPDGEHAGCVFCHARESGDKGVGTQDRANFFGFDKTKFHKLEDEVRVLSAGVVATKGKVLKEGRDYRMTKYPPCRGRKCKWCVAHLEATSGGWKWWDLATTYGDQVVELATAEVPLYCKCGASEEDEETGERYGTISVSRWMCSACEEEVHFDPEDGVALARCGSCNKKLPPMGEIECSACDEPERCDLQDFWVKAKRTGNDKSTTYTFELLHPPKPPTDEELDDAEKEYPDWDKVLQPHPAELQAATLGIVSPYGESEDIGSDEYGDAESDIDFGRGAPASRKKKSNGIMLKPPGKAAGKRKIQLRA